MTGDPKAAQSKIVLSAGQCGFDNSAIGALLKRVGAELRAVHSHAETLARAGTDAPALILVNRIFDADGSVGLDLIRTLKTDPALKNIPVMLVSNYPEAQAEAEKLGAIPGFGKSQLHADESIAKLARILSS